MFLAPWSRIVEGKALADAFHFFTISFLRHMADVLGVHNHIACSSFAATIGRGKHG
jgi:hypothetical protein